MRQNWESSIPVKSILIVGLFILIMVVILSACSKPAEQPADKGNTTDQAASDSPKDASGETQEPDERLFNILQDEMVGDTHMLGIVCEPNIDAYTSDDLKKYAGILVERYKAMPKIRIEFYNIDEEPGVNTPTVVYEWTKDTGLVQQVG